MHNKPDSYWRHLRHRAAQEHFSTRLAREVTQAGKVARAASLRPWRAFFDIDAQSLDDIPYTDAVIRSRAKPAERVHAAVSIKARRMQVPVAEQRSLAAFESNTSPEFKRLVHHLRSRLWGRLGHHNAARRSQRWSGRHK